MEIALPQKVTSIIETLEKHGFEAYAVGGCVRDSVLGRTPTDWDVTTSAKPAEVKALFARTVDTGIAHGTVTVLLGNEGFEVTTYRIDGEYEDARHPRGVTFTASLPEDLKRRDFTINAMAYNGKRGLVDEFGGLSDLKKGVVRCVGAPQERFGEDALRMLRAVRFSAQLDFEIERGTKDAICALSAKIGKVSAERIQAELVKLLISDHPERLLTAWETGLTAVFLPEFDAMMATPQNNPHHCYSVGEHTLAALSFTPPDKVARLAVLFHDVAKPLCRTTDENGCDHFHGHQKEGARMTREIMRRLKFDNDTTERVSRLVECHDDTPPLAERAVRRAVCRNGEAQYPVFFDVRRADILAQSDYERSEKLAYLDGYRRIYGEIMRKNQCLSIKQLAVNGDDLIACGMKPGKEIGDTLRALFDYVLEHPEDNVREKLLLRVHKNEDFHI